LTTVSGHETCASAAHRYALAGWPVFPCRPGSKTPATTHGFEDATCDPGVITAWWRLWPDANVAIATGAPGPDVLDVDTGPAGSGWDSFARLRDAGLLAGARALVRTRSGGIHVYYRGVQQGCGSLKRHHIDFRSAGGYVIAPPSWVDRDDKGPAGRYELLDHRPADGTVSWAAVRAALDPPHPPRPTPRPPGRLARATGGRRVAAALAAPMADRSAALWRLVAAALADGLDAAAVHELAVGYPPAVTKYGSRLAAEVDRCLAKLRATR
jgi:hypothetical protein